MKYFAILFLLIFALGCKKDEIPTYEGKDGISFFKSDLSEPDSVNYTFALSLVSKSIDTVFIPMRLVGKPSTTARSIKLKALDGSTARANVDYIFPEIKLEPNQLTVNYPLVLLNSAEMKTKTFKLVIGVDPNSELIPGVPGTAADFSVNFQKMTVNITNRLIEPSYWSSISGAFGEFSVVKFQFMVKATGLTDFDPEKVGSSALFRILIQLRNALTEYESVNGPLIDENNKRINF